MVRKGGVDLKFPNDYVDIGPLDWTVNCWFWNTKRWIFPQLFIFDHGEDISVVLYGFFNAQIPLVVRSPASLYPPPWQMSPSKVWAHFDIHHQGGMKDIDVLVLRILFRYEFYRNRVSNRKLSKPQNPNPTIHKISIPFPFSSKLPYPTLSTHCSSAYYASTVPDYAKSEYHPQPPHQQADTS
jgi:hypothetical protein